MRMDKFRGNIFVANLPKDWTDEQLAAVFDPYGIVIAAFLARDQATGATKNHGLVALAPDRAVEKAVAAINGTEIDGKRVEVRPADPEMALALPRRARAPASVTYDSRPTPPRRAFEVEYRTPRRRPTY